MPLFISATDPGFAAIPTACSSLGLTVGKSCGYLGSDYPNPGIVMQQWCTSPSENCTIVDCGFIPGASPACRCENVLGASCNCASNPTCVTTGWEEYRMGAEKMVSSASMVLTNVLSGCQCVKTEIYRCSIGYYSTNGTPNWSSPPIDGSCTACTSISSSTGLPTNTATTASAGSTSHTQCYIPAGSGNFAHATCGGVGSCNWPNCYSN